MRDFLSRTIGQRTADQGGSRGTSSAASGARNWFRARADICKFTLLVLFSIGLFACVGPLACVVGAAGLFVWRQRVGGLVRHGLENDSGAGGAMLAVLMLIGFCYMTPPGAPDDVLRDIASASYGFDYHRMYPHADIQRYNAYLGFDHLLAAIGAVAGPVGALHLMQAAGIAAFLVLFVLMGRRLSSGLRPEHYALIGLAFATPLSARIFLARPEVILTVWGLFAAVTTKRWHVVLWVAAGALLATGYWLAALYFPFALLLSTRYRTRIALGLLLVGWSFVFWHFASHGTYFESLDLLSSWPKNRVAIVSETGSFLVLLLNPYTLALILLAGVSCSGRKLGARDYEVLLLIGYFCLSGMVRYAAVWTGLLLLLVFPMLETRRVQNLWLRAGLLFFPFYCAAASFGSAMPLSQLPAFTYPENAYVLTGFNTATFSTPFFNPGRVSVAPSMELGANTHTVQALASNLSKGTLDCNKLLAEPFTHVVEDRLRTVPPCLHLLAVQGAWRQWQVVR